MVKEKRYRTFVRKLGPGASGPRNTLPHNTLQNILPLKKYIIRGRQAAPFPAKMPPSYLFFLLIYSRPPGIYYRGRRDIINLSDLLLFYGPFKIVLVFLLGPGIKLFLLIL